MLENVPEAMSAIDDVTQQQHQQQQQQQQQGIISSSRIEGSVASDEFLTKNKTSKGVASPHKKKSRILGCT